MTEPTREDKIELILEQLPSSAGVYQMKDTAGKVIYVGKAVNLRSRVRSYFRDSGDQRYSVRFLRDKVADIEVVLTDTEKEALLLENTLIKKYQPRYNIRLRDDKTYLSLRLDVEHKWPRVHGIRKRRDGDRARYFGPFSSSRSLKETLRFLQKLFPLRSCPDSVLNNRSRPCILHQIERCSAPCVNLIEKEKYDELVQQTILFLDGRTEEVMEILRKRMWDYSGELQYEKAAVIRDRLIAIESTVEQEKVVDHRVFDRDVLGLVRERGRMVVTILCFRKGKLEETPSFDFKDPGLPDEEVLESFIGQFYEAGRTVPRDILISNEVANPELVREALQAMRGGPVRLLHPQRGDKVRLLEMALANARQELEKRLAGEKSRDQVMKDLERKLNLSTLPRRIECFDISNFQGSFVVASMTCFVDGEPEKSQYRHFKVKSVEGQDDFASMQEVLERRYTRQLKEGATLPDLVVIDGGKGQLNSAIEVFKNLGLLGKVPLCGLAKARLRGGKQGTGVIIRTEERVFMPNRKDPIRFDQSDPALFILTRIRDEAHRFGVTYHRKLRNMASLRTGLEELPGIGPRRRKALLQHFGSLTRLKNASTEEIAAVDGIPPTLAATVYQFLHAPIVTEAIVSDDETEANLDEAATDTLFADEEAESEIEDALDDVGEEGTDDSVTP